MIEENSVHYLDKDDIRSLHDALSEKARASGEPIPPFSCANENDLDALVHSSRQRFFGADAYPTIEEKAAILFYTVNKRQIFLNGNKRMSTLCLLVFLDANGKALRVEPDELTAKALWLARTSSLDFPDIKMELVEWIRNNSIDGNRENRRE